MKRLMNLLMLVVLLVFFASPVAAQTVKGIEGNWIGTVDLGGLKMRLAFKVTRKNEQYTAKLDSIDQGVTDLDMQSVIHEADSVKFIAPNLGIVYEGKLNEAGDEIAGSLKQGPAVRPLVLKHMTNLPEIGRPQDPRKPLPYIEEEVSYRNEKDNVKLAGTLTLPQASGNYPAVVLITGSGPQDRNETIMGHRPFLVLADALTRKGIAVLRVDDRGMGGSDQGQLTATSANYAEDVLAGVAYLKTRKEINPKQIGLIGHSEGGMIAPMAAARSSDVAFIVLLAGPGQTGTDVIYKQTELIHQTGGVTPAVTARTLALLKSIFDILQSQPDNKLAEQQIRNAIVKSSATLSEEEKTAFASTSTAIETQLPLYLSQWFRFFLLFDPQPTLKKVRVPVLALNGELDVQVSWKENLDLIASALKAGGNRDYTVKSFPKLNHLFQTSETGAISEYVKIEETISPIVLDTITSWIRERTVKP